MYTGEFQDSDYAGHGTYTFSDGSRHEGGWLKGSRHGHGTYYDSENRIISAGEWSDDQFVGK